MKKTLFLFVLLTFLCGCSSDIKPEVLSKKITVSGEILYVQESMGWNTPIHTVIKTDSGKIVRVCGVWGSDGDKVTVTGTEFK